MLFEVFKKYLFGLKEVKRQAYQDGSIRSIWLELNEGVLMIEKSGSFDSISQKGWHLLSFKIESDQKDEWKSRLDSMTVKISSQSDYTMYFSDPEGNRLALSSYPNPL